MKLNKQLKKIVTFGLGISLILGSGVSASAAEGEVGIFGGISEGDNLPKNITKYVDFEDSTTSVYDYKEIIFLSGEPIEVTGSITVDIEDENVLTQEMGIYTESYIIEAANVDNDISLSRSVSIDTGYRIDEGDFIRQIITSSKLNSWAETISTSDGTYSLSTDDVNFSKSSIEDITAGISYYSTSITYDCLYSDESGNTIWIDVINEIEGYSQPWSKVEKQDVSYTINSDSLNMNVVIKPKIEAKKTIYFEDTEPYPISFGGTYLERFEREAVLNYDILSTHSELSDSQLSGAALISPSNGLEKLPIPEGLDFIEGHWAEDDIKKLYSLGIFTETAHEGMHYEAMSRGDFVKALCLAMDIDISNHVDAKEDALQVFGDVSYDHPLYPYIMGAYDAKLVQGTGENFDVNFPITREEAFVIYIRVIGLEGLGVTGSPVTPFLDDDSIASWAKKEIMAGYRLGIIQGDESGNVNPKQWISKAEAAAIVNRLVDYCREDIGEAY